MVVVRSTLLALVQIILTPIFAVAALLSFPFDALTRYRIITLWSRLVIAAAKSICGVRYRVEGLQHLPATPAIIVSKHQSAWETLAFQVIFPPQVWVLKKHLLRIPFFGWGLAMMNPIAIDRGSGMRALRQTREQGSQRLRDGFWIVIFPEGTRVAPGDKAKYQMGGAWLAVETETPLLPVALNSGELWGKRAFLKYPGEITVRIGAPIAPEGLKPGALNRRIEDWIESEMRTIAGTARSG
ncbi:MAG: 1-acyl-sn-glycerol-3-phosphate acyltransferase [Burkholderiales bacterium]|nr:1-acyl-sn-glycerol-3-phosphate acyltransferase [Burkholderiales bacterium]